MYRTILIAFLFAVFCNSFAQEIKQDLVPKAVLERFNHTFPQAVDLPVKWFKEKGNYKATLTIMESPATMILDSLGNQKRLERRINESYLPESAKSHLKKLDPKYQVVSVTKIIDDKNKTSYKTVARIITNVTFDEEGKVANTK